VNGAYGQGLYGQGLYGGLSVVAVYEPDNYRVKITVGGLAGDEFVEVNKFLTSPSGGAEVIDDVRAGRLEPPSFPTSVFYDYELQSGWTHRYAAVTDLRAQSFADEIVPPFPSRLVLKSPMRPFLNTPVTIQEVGPATRQSRAGLFYVVGAERPIARTSVRGGRTLTLSVLTVGTEEFEALDALLAAGDVVYLDPPSAVPTALPSYVQVDSYTETRTGRLNAARKIFDLSLIEVQAPDFNVGGVQVTWTSETNSYATWADLVAAYPTWLDVLKDTANASEVIVP
jgi:hypothetical protein